MLRRHSEETKEKSMRMHRPEIAGLWKDSHETTMDTSNSSTLQAASTAHITESSTHLEEVVLRTVVKTKHYVNVFMYLAELS